MSLAKKLANKSLAEITKAAAPKKVKRTVRRSSTPSVKEIYKASSHPFADLLGMSHEQQTEALAGVTPAGLMLVIQALAEELRRLNALAEATGPDASQGPDASHDYTAGESNNELGLSKAQRTRVSRVLERVLENALRVNDLRKQNVDAQEIGASRRVPRTLDELEAWGDRQDRIRNALAHAPDTDQGAAALGISRSMQAASNQIAKSGAALPNDSATGMHINVAEQMARQANRQGEVHKAAVSQHWSQRSRR